MERGYFQWAFIRALAFGERDWILLCSLMFLASKSRDFLTLPGMTCFFLGLILFGPVFGMLIYAVNKLMYIRLKRKKRLPKTLKGLKRLTWIANAYCFPLVVFLSWTLFNLFYESFDSYSHLTLGGKHL